LFHNSGTLFNHRTDRPRDIVWQQVGDPDQAAAPAIFGEDLHRGVVVRGLSLDYSVGDPASLVVNVDKQFARHHAVGERYNPGFSVEASVHDEPRCQASVYRTNIANRRPDAFGSSIDQDFLTDGSHLYVSFVSRKIFEDNGLPRPSSSKRLLPQATINRNVAHIPRRM
jgi:hypothetical protein